MSETFELHFQLKTIEPDVRRYLQRSTVLQSTGTIITVVLPMNDELLHNSADVRDSDDVAPILTPQGLFEAQLALRQPFLDAHDAETQELSDDSFDNNDDWDAEDFDDEWPEDW